MKMTKPFIVSLTNVGKKYGRVTAVSNVDLSLDAKECVALVGHNGAGKSTLIKILLGLVKPSVGTVSVLNHDPFTSDFNDIRRSIGFLPEQVLFQKNMTGTETLAFYAKLKRLHDRKFGALFSRVGLEGAADRKVGTYSKGMRQKLGMAQALMGCPGLLVLDEPTTGLDPIARQNIYKIIEEEKERGATVLISSHALTELDGHVDRVAILKLGEIVAAGPIPVLRKDLNMNTTIVVAADHDICRQIEKLLYNRFEIDRLAGGQLSIACPTQQKIQALSAVLALGLPIDDIGLKEPTLESVYNSYSSIPSDGGKNV
jgi:Cu-processing system ATP-binding protein